MRTGNANVYFNHHKNNNNVSYTSVSKHLLTSTDQPVQLEINMKSITIQIFILYSILLVYNQSSIFCHQISSLDELEKAKTADVNPSKVNSTDLSETMTDETDSSQKFQPLLSPNYTICVKGYVIFNGKCHKIRKTSGSSMT